MWIYIAHILFQGTAVSTNWKQLRRRSKINKWLLLHRVGGKGELKDKAKILEHDWKEHVVSTSGEVRWRVGDSVSEVQRDHRVTQMWVGGLLLDVSIWKVSVEVSEVTSRGGTWSLRTVEKVSSLDNLWLWLWEPRSKVMRPIRSLSSIAQWPGTHKREEPNLEWKWAARTSKSAVPREKEDNGIRDGV